MSTETNQSELVTVGVPVYEGHHFVGQALASLQKQTHLNLEVIISLDGPDPLSEAVCREFLSDPRFRLVVQPERLGWAGNINWLMTQARGGYWYYQQQDDWVEESYVEVLLGHLRENPEAALAYCDMINFGTFDGTVSKAPSVEGPASVRALNLLLSPYLAVGFRGLTRIEAVRSIGGVPMNEYGGFGCDMTRLMAVARAGELHRVPLSLYRKLYHAGGIISGWLRFGKEQAIRAWATHCMDMLQQALLVYGLTPQETRLLWLAAIGRLTSPNTAGRYLDLAALTQDDRQALLSAFLCAARGSWLPNLKAMSEADWEQLTTWAGAFYRLNFPLDQNDDSTEESGA